MDTSRETRRAAHEAVMPKKAARRAVLLDAMRGRQMTVSELAQEILDLGLVPYYDRNFVAPRLTELRELGKIRAIGKRASKRTGKLETVYEVI